MKCEWLDVLRPLAYAAFHEDMLRSFIGDALGDNNPVLKTAAEWLCWLKTYPEDHKKFFPPTLQIFDAFLAMRGLPEP